jgi:membrane protease YdiL (CAAX protease family)
MATGKSVPSGRFRRDEPIPVSWVLIFYGLLGALAVAWRLWVDGMLPWRVAPDAALAPLWLRLGLGVAVGLVLVTLSRQATEHTQAGRALAEELSALVGPLSTGRALGFALASGLAEEAFFRGALQPRVGLVAATLLFGAAHYVPRPGLRAWSLFALAAGAVFGALYQWTGDLIAPALAHVVVNGLNLRWLAERTFVKLSSSRSPRRPPS